MGKYSEETIQRWIEMYRADKSFREIGASTSTPFATVSYYLGKRGVLNRRTPGRKRKHVGLTDREIVWRRNIRKYGISVEQYEEMLVAQDGACAICGKKPKGEKTSSSRLNIDHDHQTKKVRGLLCNNCNNGLGKLGDSAEVLERAAAYLRRGA
jgi:hypothetical protein